MYITDILDVFIWLPTVFQKGTGLKSCVTPMNQTSQIPRASEMKLEVCVWVKENQP